jgi:outer membrane protein OmpU
MDGVTVDVSYVPSGASQAESSMDYGVSYTGIDGLTIGMVEGENTATAGAHTDTTILYANYAMDSITVGFTSSEQDSETANSDVDFSAMGISYAASEELSVSLNSSTHDYELATKSDQEAFGISVSYVMGSMTLSANHNTVDNAAGTASDDRSGYNLALAFAF